MPVECSISFEPIEQERFHAVDRVVMRHAFDIHNALGRFCDERIYQDELARRCRDSGLDVQREVLIRPCHQGFAKPYYLDMLVERGAIYELKTVETFTNAHQTQLINNLLLAGLNHGKLVNFRPASVESRFVSTLLHQEDRTAFRLDDAQWCGDDVCSQRLLEVFRSLLADWGTFLDANLYREALLHFLGGPEAGVQPVAIQVGGRTLGVQRMCLLNPKTAWHLSAVHDHFTTYQKHLVRLLSHTDLDKIHWLNLNQRSITIKTLLNDSATNDSVTSSPR